MVAAVASVILCALYLYITKKQYRINAWYHTLGHAAVFTAVVWVVQKFTGGAMIASIAACALYSYMYGLRLSDKHKIPYSIIDGAIFAFIVLTASIVSRGLVRMLWLDLPSWHYLNVIGGMAIISAAVLLLSYISIFLLDKFSKNKDSDSLRPR